MSELVCRLNLKGNRNSEQARLLIGSRTSVWSSIVLLPTEYSCCSLKTKSSVKNFHQQKSALSIRANKRAGFQPQTDGNRWISSDEIEREIERERERRREISIRAKGFHWQRTVFLSATRRASKWKGLFSEDFPCHLKELSFDENSLSSRL